MGYHYDIGIGQDFKTGCKKHRLWMKRLVYLPGNYHRTQKQNEKINYN